MDQVAGRLTVSNPTTARPGDHTPPPAERHLGQPEAGRRYVRPVADAQMKDVLQPCGDPATQRGDTNHRARLGDLDKMLRIAEVLDLVVPLARGTTSTTG